MSLVETIRLHRACNQGCTFCTLRDAVANPLPTAEVERRLADGRARGVPIVRFTGGEPTLDRRLPRFVRRARELGYEHVEIETNATVFAYGETAEAYRAAGLTRAFGTLLAPLDAANDRISRDPGGAARSWAGLGNLAARGVRIGLCLPVTAETAPGLADLVDRAQAALPTLDAVRFFVVTSRQSPVPYAVVEAGLARAASRCRKHRLDHRFDPSYCPPPCAFSERFVRSHTPLFASLHARPEGMDAPPARIAACSSCALTERCAGYPEAYVRGLPEALPTEPPGEHAVAALRGQLGGVERGQRNQLKVVQTRTGDRSVEKPNVRVSWACNQRCRFCWVDFDWTPPTRDQVLRQIEEVADAGARVVSITGGEPLLVPWLPDVVRAASARGFERIEVQTNGVHLTSDLVARLEAAGVTDLLVSLHSHVPEVSDAITQSPGDCARTLAGIDTAVGSRITVSVNHVITRRNLATTLGFPDYVHGRWGRRVEITWSVAAPITEASLRYDDAIVPFDEAGPVLLGALERCVELGLAFGGQDSTCGVPPCVLGGDARFLRQWFEQGHADSASFVKVEECSTCTHASTCRGVQRAYVKAFGSRGIRTLSVPVRLRSTS